MEWPATSPRGLGFTLSTWTPWELLGALSSRPPSLICCSLVARQRADLAFHSAPRGRNRANIPGPGLSPAPGPQTPHPPWSPRSSRLLRPVPQPVARPPLPFQSAGSGTAEPDAGPFVRRAAIRVPRGRSDRLRCPSPPGRLAGTPGPPVLNLGRVRGRQGRRRVLCRRGAGAALLLIPTPCQAEDPRWRSLWENSDFPERHRRCPGGGLLVLDGKFQSSGGWGLLWAEPGPSPGSLQWKLCGEETSGAARPAAHAGGAGPSGRPLLAWQG